MKNSPIPFKHAQTDCFNLYFSDYFRIITLFPWMEFVVRTWGTAGALSHLAWSVFYGHIPDVRMGSYQDSSSPAKKSDPGFIHRRKSTDGWDWLDPLRTDSTALQFRRPKTGFRQSWDFDLRFNSYPDFSFPKFKKLVSVSTTNFLWKQNLESF